MSKQANVLFAAGLEQNYLHSNVIKYKQIIETLEEQTRLRVKYSIFLVTYRS